MRNVAYGLSTAAALGGLGLLMIAGPEGNRTALGTALLGVALLLWGLGKGVDLLGYVQEGAARSDE
jgi:hypothetical protein